MKPVELEQLETALRQPSQLLDRRHLKRCIQRLQIQLLLRRFEGACLPALFRPVPRFLVDCLLRDSKAVPADRLVLEFSLELRYYLVSNLVFLCMFSIGLDCRLRGDGPVRRALQTLPGQRVRHPAVRGGRHRLFHRAQRVLQETR